MSKTRRLDFTSVGSGRTVRHQIDAKFALWCFDGCVCCARWHLITLSPKLKVMNDGFHIIFHCGAARRRKFAIVDLNVTFGHLIETLVDDTDRLTHFLNTTQVAIITVSTGTNWYIKLDQIVCVVWASFSNIPLDSRSAEHNSRKSVGLSGFIRHGSNVNISVSPNSVFGQHFFGLVQPSSVSLGPIVNIVTQSNG